MSTFQPLDTFQVHIKLPDIFTRRFAALIPQHRGRVNQLMEERTILNYALDRDGGRLCVTLQAYNH